MNITPMTITVRELTENYIDDGDAVIEIVLKGYPLNTMYWSKIGDDMYEVLDRQ